MIVYNVIEGIDQALSKHCNFMQDNIDDELTEEYSQLANEAISFRQEVLNALGSPNNAISSIKVLQMSCAEYSAFRRNVKQLLIDLIGRDITDDEAIAEIERLQQQSLEADTPRPIDQIEIAKLKRELSIANKVIAKLVGE